MLASNSQGHFIKPIITGKDFAPGYLDIRINQAGFRHIAYFSPPDAQSPIFLSDGEWEVDGKISAVDFEKKLVLVFSLLFYSSSIVRRSRIDQEKESLKI
jgi:hypothetical protein